MQAGVDVCRAITPSLLSVGMTSASCSSAKGSDAPTDKMQFCRVACAPKTTGRSCADLRKKRRPTDWAFGKTRTIAANETRRPSREVSCRRFLKCSLKVFVKFSLAIIFCLFAAGCTTSTIESRKKERLAIYTALPPDQKQLVDHGQIKVGMGPDAIYIAW